ncbi:MAG TPA: DNA-3-methyladenine glycosylase [Gemmatimonadaceae bacterium]
MTAGALRRARRSSGARPLAASFYDREADLVARDLLGAVLEHRSPEGGASGRIVEVEAYMGPHDPACHAAAGLTPRTRPLFGPPGTSYVYFIYGNHWCVNAVTREAGYGAAVLIRALEPLEGIALMQRRRPLARRESDLANGPGKLCAALGIDAGQNALSLQQAPLRILAGEPVDDDLVLVSPRVGISKAASEMLRFFVADNPYVSRVPSSIECQVRNSQKRERR